MDSKARKIVLAVQRAEETEHLIYMQLSTITKDEKNAEILRKIGIQEKGHARFWENISGTEVKPDMWRVFRVVWMARILGLTFVLKLMEKREGTGSAVYEKLAEYFPESNALPKRNLYTNKNCSTCSTRKVCSMWAPLYSG